MSHGETIKREREAKQEKERHTESCKCMCKTFALNFESVSFFLEFLNQAIKLWLF